MTAKKWRIELQYDDDKNITGGLYTKGDLSYKVTFKKRPTMEIIEQKIQEFI